MSRRRQSIVAGVVLGTLMLGCQSMQQPEEQRLYAACLGESAVIGPDGGTISVGSYTLTFPQGALLTNTLITVDQEVCGAWPVRCKPDGTQFWVPVTLEMDASGEPDPGSMSVQWWNPAQQRWESLASTHNGSTVSTQIQHFSRYSIG